VAYPVALLNLYNIFYQRSPGCPGFFY